MRFPRVDIVVAAGIAGFVVGFIFGKEDGWRKGGDEARATAERREEEVAQKMRAIGICERLAEYRRRERCQEYQP